MLVISDNCSGQINLFQTISDFYSVLSEGSGSDSDADHDSRYGVDGETDEDEGAFFDTNDFLSAESLRSASYRSRDNPIYGYSPWAGENESSFSGLLRDSRMEIKTVEFPYVKRRDNLPEPKEKEKPIGLWSIIKDNIGKDLSGVCLPVYFNEPLSSLQKCFEDLEYSYLVDRALEWGKQVRSSFSLHFCGYLSEKYLLNRNNSGNLWLVHYFCFVWCLQQKPETTLFISCLYICRSSFLCFYLVTNDC